VPQRPQRPFVPHRTPKAARPVTTGSEFRLSRPFVPGTPREQLDAASEQPIAKESAPAIRPTRSEDLPPIEVFLDHEVSTRDEEPPELPPVEHFLDPLPAVGGFAPDAEGALIDESTVAADYRSATTADAVATEPGWGVDDWQQYDWRAAATLGEGVESQASNEWATTDWDGGTRTPISRSKPSAAHAIANALDQIAQQIREGDLTLPSPGGSLADPGSIAATLAALLGVKR
jgi:hypothetical protein